MLTQDQGFIWLASYPKSGNTWFRAFHTNLMENKDTPAQINQFMTDLMASSRFVLDGYAGLELSDLTQDEIEKIRPQIYKIIVQEKKEPLLVKIHDAYTHTCEGFPLVPLEATRGVIYILRNPLDVAVSFAYHNACDIDTMIASMADDSFCLSCRPDRIGGQLRQRLLSWSNHVLSWVDGMGDALHLMRYEDMVMQPLETFLSAVRFAHFPDDLARVQKAIRFSEFSELQKQENLQGFNQKPQKAASFFRKGKVGSWRESLTSQQARQIIKDHRGVMKRFGYLDDQDDPIF